MNLLGRYNMLRTAVIAMIGVPDDVEKLKQMATVLREPALTDVDAAASLLVLQTLIITHAGSTKCKRCESDKWQQVGSTAGAMMRCEGCGNTRFPVPGEKLK